MEPNVGLSPNAPRDPNAPVEKCNHPPVRADNKEYACWKCLCGRDPSLVTNAVIGELADEELERCGTFKEAIHALCQRVNAYRTNNDPRFQTAKLVRDELKWRKDALNNICLEYDCEHFGEDVTAFHSVVVRCNSKKQMLKAEKLIKEKCVITGRGYYPTITHWAPTSWSPKPTCFSTHIRHDHLVPLLGRVIASYSIWPNGVMLPVDHKLCVMNTETVNA